MNTGDFSLHSTSHDLLKQILVTLQSIQSDYRQLSTALDTIEGRVNTLAGVKQIYDAAGTRQERNDEVKASDLGRGEDGGVSSVTDSGNPAPLQIVKPASSGRSPTSTVSSRIILTTYPGQSGIDPLVLNWGHRDPLQRGPVVVSRSQSTIRRRNGTREGVLPLSRNSNDISSQLLGLMVARTQFIMRSLLPAKILM